MPRYKKAYDLYKKMDLLFGIGLIKIVRLFFIKLEHLLVLLPIDHRNMGKGLFVLTFFVRYANNYMFFVYIT